MFILTMYLAQTPPHFPDWHGQGLQAIGITLESHQFDIIEKICERTHDTLLLSYATEAVPDTGVSLSYHNQVLHKLLPLFPSPTTESKSLHIHTLTRLLVTLGDASLTVPLLTARETFGVSVCIRLG